MLLVMILNTVFLKIDPLYKYHRCINLHFVHGGY